VKYWWFKFEGWFNEDSGENGGQGVFSECLVKANTYDEAESDFLTALTARGINLIEVEDNFPVDLDPEKLDYSDADYLYWIEWSEETDLAGGPTFETFHLYPADEVDKSVVETTKE